MRLVLLIVTVSSFMTAFAASSLNVALPVIGAELHLDGISLNWVVTSFVLATAMFLMPMGRLGDIHGRKRIFAIGLAIYCLSSLAAGLAGSGALLIASRVLTGLGAAMIFATSTAILVSVYPPDQRGRVLGITVAAVYAGISAGPFLSGLITQQLGWRWLFLVHTGLSLSVFVMVLAGLRDEWHTAKGERFDLPGALLYAAGLAALLIGLSMVPSPLGLALGGIGLIGLLVFGWFERGKASPLFHVDLFLSNRTFAWSNIAALINYAATFAVAFFLSLYLEVVRGWPPQNAGLLMLVQPLIQTVFSPFSGRLSDRIAPGLLSSTGMGCCSLGLLCFVFVGADTNLALVVAAQILLGLGFALFSSPNTNAVMGSVDRHLLGTASATIATMRVIGQMLSMAIALALFALIMGHTEVNQASAGTYLGAMHLGFVICATLCVLGIFASLARNPRPA